MSRHSSSNGETAAALAISGISCLSMLGIWLIPSFILAFWTESNINQFLILTGKATECPYWLAWIPSFFFLPVTFVLNIIAEIVQLFI